MSGTGDDLVQMRFHFGERDRDGDGPLDAAVMDACARRGVRVGALLRGVEGFGAKQRLRTDRLLSLSEDTPLVAVAVAGADVIDALADEVRQIAAEGLQEAYFKDHGRRAHDLSVEFTDIDYVELDF